MTYDNDPQPGYRGRRRTPTPAFPIPGVAGGGLVGLSTPDGPAPRPQPQPDPDDSLRPYERALDMIKNVVVVITCLAILYAMWSVYNALAEVSDRLQQLPL